ncbi:hypothetical protein OHA18_42095 [Kribbella sp. NBC_00709]|uniref:hypothetical protein n=1 Tax=Kribbella sp. NBC_00709 TaxID=2975972 RepID=UPI002E2D8289|nr:hypothetical protein [Kribbella sp. NBC_00709]
MPEIHGWVVAGDRLSSAAPCHRRGSEGATGQNTWFRDPLVGGTVIVREQEVVVHRPAGTRKEAGYLGCVALGQFTLHHDDDVACHHMPPRSGDRVMLLVRRPQTRRW